MNVNTAFPSKYLRAADLGTKTPTVTIKDVKVETVGEDSKLVVYFEKAEKGLVLNKTNANAIADILGTEETDDWSGHRIKLVVAKVDYQGKRVPAVRIEEPGSSNGKPNNGSTRHETRPAPRQEPVDTPNDDDIPFAWLLPLLLPALSVFGSGVLA